jgi:hypothetical protein
VAGPAVFPKQILALAGIAFVGRNDNADRREYKKQND